MWAWIEYSIESSPLLHHIGQVSLPMIKVHKIRRHLGTLADTKCKANGAAVKRH